MYGGDMNNRNLILADGERQVELCLGAAVGLPYMGVYQGLRIKRVADDSRNMRIELHPVATQGVIDSRGSTGALSVDHGQSVASHTSLPQRQLIDLSLFLLNSVHPVPCKLQGYYIDIISHLLDEHRSEPGLDLRGTKRKSFTLLAEYIDANIKMNISVQNLVEHSHMSERSLYYLFNEAVRMTPLAYIRQQKIKSVYRELCAQHSCRSITQVAMDFGFSNLGRFSEVYRKQMGELPSETRMKWQG